MSAIVESLATALEAAPDNWKCRLALVEALCGEIRNEEAILVLNEVDALPEDQESLLQAGRAYGFLEPGSGIEIFDSIIAADPMCAAAHREKADLCFALSDLEGAKRHYYTAVTFDASLADPTFATNFEHIQEPEQSAPQEYEPAPPPEPEVAPEPVPAYQEEAAPAPVQPVPLAPPGDREQVYYPEPGEVPVVTLSQAIAATPATHSRVTPDTVPPHPQIEYARDVTHQPLVHTSPEQFHGQLNNVAVHPPRYEEAVTYDYQAPDDSIFDPTITPDDIYVSALVTESGEAVASIKESIDRSRSESRERKSIAEKRSKIQSLCVAILTMVLICVGLGLVAAALPRPNPPQIAASVLAEDPQAEDLEEQKLVQPKVNNQIQPPDIGAAAMDMVAVSSVSDLSVTTFDNSGIGFGMADSGMSFGASMSFGSGGSDAMFFGSKTSGKRFMFVLDNSASMTTQQIELRNGELEKTLKTLRNVEYQILLFAGGAFFAEKGWGVDKSSKGNAPTKFVSPKGKYEFTSKGLFQFDLVGKDEDFPSPKWAKATPSNIRKSIEMVKETKKFGGTDWDMALKLAHLMDPEPDVIFFMSDGLDKVLDVKQIVRNSKKEGGPVINSVSMQTKAGAEAFDEIARRTGGKFTIVDKDGKPIDGSKFLKDPDEYKDRL